MSKSLLQMVEELNRKPVSERAPIPLANDKNSYSPEAKYDEQKDFSSATPVQEAMRLLYRAGRRLPQKIKAQMFQARR